MSKPFKGLLTCNLYLARGFNYLKNFTALSMVSLYLYSKTEKTNLKYKLSISREMSKVYGYLFHLPLSENIGPPLFKAFSWVFNVNLEEIDRPLTEFKSMNEFFARKLKQGSRVIDPEALVSPCDSRVLSFGYAYEKIYSVKGVNYSLVQLITGDDKLAYDKLKNRLMKGKDTELYYITLYLAPGDYHRFHSPADWRVLYRRHIFGYMQGVFSKNLQRKSDVFATNERIVYTGEWKHGRMIYIPVAAFNVGDISIINDRVKTNLCEFENDRVLFHDKELQIDVEKGAEFGAFNAGSTIILVFEAPRHADWAVNLEDKVLVGNKLLNIY